MTPTKIIRFLFVLSLFTSPLIIYCQELPTTKTFTPADTVRTVEILPGVRKLEYRKIDSVTEIQILAGNVRLRQGNTIFECDSCVITKRINLFEAFGNVHINDSDTANVYSDHLRYLTDRKIAYLDGNVKLTDGKGVLTTPTLEYDMNTKVGIYRNGGRVENGKTILTSEEGFYYADLKDVYFKKNVKLKDPSYDLQSDSLLYNTGTEIVRFIAETLVKDSTNRTIRTREGYYDKRTGKAEFGQHPVITDKDIQVTGERIISDDSLGITQIFGRGIIVDTANKTTVIADTIFYNKKNESFLAFAKPLMIVEQEQDSIFIAADTLFSARLTDLYGAKDSVVKKDTLKGVKIVDTNPKDSTNRYFEAFRHVRVFSDSLQSVCDSLFYSFKDSVFRLYDDPVVWSNENQVTGDTILLFTKNKKADRMQVFKNSFIASYIKPEIFNQVSSTRMDAYFIDGNIDSVRARGSAECVYYIQDEDSAFTGINQSNAELMDVYFKEKEIQRVVFRTAVKGTIWPMKQKTPREMQLQNFRWRDAERPKTKYELFE
ncbi:MAG TPA: OstA-like protein [Chitinophagaceae bacterium]|jgi:lipopolysaccharide export system protein LptA|nr:OstA-like protein [Chitinophagaceae bacterium]